MRFYPYQLSSSPEYYVEQVAKDHPLVPGSVQRTSSEECVRQFPILSRVRGGRGVGGRGGLGVGFGIWVAVSLWEVRWWWVVVVVAAGGRVLKESKRWACVERGRGEERSGGGGGGAEKGGSQKARKL